MRCLNRLFLFLLLLNTKMLLGGSPSVPSHPRLLKDDKGNIAAFWLLSGSNQTTLTSAIYFPQVGWSTAVTVSTADRNIISLPQIAMNSSGEIVAVWKSYCPSTEQTVFEAAFSSITEGEWTTPTIISETTGYSQDPVVNIDDQSNATIVWCGSSSDELAEFALNFCMAQHKGSWSLPTSLPNAP